MSLRTGGVQVDADGDGKVSIEEFLKFLRRPAPSARPGSAGRGGRKPAARPVPLVAPAAETSGATATAVSCLISARHHLVIVHCVPLLLIHVQVERGRNFKQFLAAAGRRRRRGVPVPSGDGFEVRHESHNQPALTG